MRTLRFPGETDQEFCIRAERAALVAKTLIDAALANYCIQAFIEDAKQPDTVESSAEVTPATPPPAVRH